MHEIHSTTIEENILFKYTENISEAWDHVPVHLGIEPGCPALEVDPLLTKL